MSTEIKINGGKEKALRAYAYVTWETAVDVVCRLAAQHGHDGVFSMSDAERLLAAAEVIIKAANKNKQEVSWTNKNQATGMTPNTWVEQDIKDKIKNLLPRM